MARRQAIQGSTGAGPCGPGSTVGEWIGVTDIAAVTTNNPVPMYGVKAFGFASLCSAHPVYGD